MSHPVNPNPTSESTRGATDPSTAEAASTAGFAWASALVGDAGAEPASHTLTVRGVDVPANYRFRVSGAVTAGARAGDAVEVVNENTVLGSIAAADAETDFRFSGRLVSFCVLDGDLAVTVDGDDVPVPMPADRDLANTATLRAEGDVVDYRFRVSDRVECGPLVEPRGGRVDGRVVRGTLGGQSVHNYFYAGSFELERATGPLTVTLDVDAVDE